MVTVILMKITTFNYLRSTFAAQTPVTNGERVKKKKPNTK